MKAPKSAAPADDVIVIGDVGPDLAEAADVVVVSDQDGDEPKLPKHARVQEDGTVLLPLHFPQTLKTTPRAGGVVREDLFEELHLHRLTGADMRAISATAEGKRGVVALARSARVREGIMTVLYDKLDGADAVAAGEVVGFFLNSGRTTGP